MFSERRTISTAFVNPIEITRLHAEVVGNASITTHFFGINLDVGADYCDFCFDSEPTSGEKTEIDAICAAHPTPISLGDYKSRKIEALGVEVTNYLYVRYDQQRRESLLMHYPKAIAEGKTNRAAKVKEALDWVGELHTLYVSKAGEVIAAADEAEVDAVAFDFPAFEASHPDPEVTIPEVVLIPD